jgi:proteasome accessory factor A
MLLETGWRPNLTLLNPVKAVRDISWDCDRKWVVELAGHRTMSAVDIQRVYCEEALAALDQQGTLSKDLGWAGREWMNTLDLLACNPMALGDRLDWVAKYQLLETYREEEGLDWDDPVLQSLDLAYTEVDPDAGLYHGLEQEGHTVRLVDEGRIERAMVAAPEDTRAAVRGALVEMFPEAIESLSWGGLAVRANGERVILELGVLGPESSRRYAAAVRASGSIEEAVAALSPTD